MINYFRDCKNLQELKKAYKKLAFKHHPDCGGDVEIMKAINSQYDDMFEILKNVQNTRAEAKEKGFYKTQETSDQYRDIIEKLINLEGIVIELCGNWIWLSGETKQYKAIIKEMGFYWAAKKKMWYWRADKYKSRSKGGLSIDEIRDKYGSDKFNGKGPLMVH